MKQGWNDSSEYLSLFARSLHPGWQSTSSIQPWNHGTPTLTLVADAKPSVARIRRGRAKVEQ